MPVRKRAPSSSAAPSTRGSNHHGSPDADGLQSDHVAGIQRSRLIAGMIAACAERGAGNVSVAHVVERAAVSRRTFYELFNNREDCLLAALDSVIERATEAVLNVYDPSERWVTRVRSALVGLLTFCDQDPGAGRLLVVESLGAGPEALARRERLLAYAIALLDEGRREGKAASALPPLAAEGTLGGVLSVLHTRIVERAQRPLLELTNELMSMIVLPYLGPAAARRELGRPLPKAAGRSVQRGANPLKELPIRLTYRTVRVLTAVSDDPGGSNRTIAERAGITDQGQVSKLLTRLETLGLIANEGAGHRRGAPNSWTLTEQGQAVNAMLGAQAVA